MGLRNMCRREVVWVKEGTSAREVAKLLEKNNVGCVVVVGKDSLLSPIGLVTDRDILIRVMNRGLDPDNTPIDDVMTKEVIALRENMGLLEALEYVKGKGIRRFPIVGVDGSLKGIITLDDILYLLGREMSDVASIIEKEGYFSIKTEKDLFSLWQA